MLCKIDQDSDASISQPQRHLLGDADHFCSCCCGGERERCSVNLPPPNFTLSSPESCLYLVVICTVKHPMKTSEKAEKKKSRKLSTRNETHGQHYFVALEWITIFLDKIILSFTMILCSVESIAINILWQAHPW